MASNINRRQAIKSLGVATAALAVGGATTLESCATNKSTRKMNVLLINGSPRKNGNTNRLLEEVAMQLKKNGIDSEIVHIGADVRGCSACGGCYRNGGKCVFDDDICNTLIEKMGNSDALVVGSPVYYGAPAGQVMSLLQRMAYAGGAKMQGKPAAAVTVCRRGGATAAFQALQMPFQMLNMPIVTSQYWNIGYGGGAGEVEQDAEGLQTMRTLANNMAYMLKQFATGTAKKPEKEPGEWTNFIR